MSAPLRRSSALTTRPKKSAAKYAAIWTSEGSPLRFHTEKQAKLLQGWLGERVKSPIVVDYAMRYGNPSVDSALARMSEQGCDRILTIPLYPQYEVPDTGKSRFAADAAQTQALHAAAQSVFGAGSPSLIGAATRQAFGLHAPRVHRGLIVSGDQFISTRADSDALRLSLPDALAVEMEGAAVAQVCHDYGTPFALARTLSDRADDSAHIDFGQFIHTVASAYSLALVQALLMPGS
ncbi:MAG: hypothetical protein B7Z83_02065 [Thiomonas sp. 20-64-5]|nr:MAG: hypothetical protein B7Z83_02065 [Thiomonas sp. 20-64-5]